MLNTAENIHTQPHFFVVNLFAYRKKKRFMSRLFIMSLAAMVLMADAEANEAENIPEAAGFWGQVTGVIKSAQEDGQCFVLTVSKAEVDPATSILKNSAPMISKELVIGVRMTKKPDGVSYPNAEDVAYIKTLKPGMVITVKLFTPRSNPKALRIQCPGKSVAVTN